MEEAGVDQIIKEKIEEVLDAPSCYPECERKSRDIRAAELKEWYEKYHEVNVCYNLYGQDVTDSPPVDEWLDRGLFRKQRYDVNGEFFPFGSKFPYDYTLVMRDKRTFEMFMRFVFGEANKYCMSYGYLMNRRLYSLSARGGASKIDPSELLEAFEGKKVVFKNTFGFGGDDVVICAIVNGKVIYRDREYQIESFMESLNAPNSIWLIQSYLEQHPFMKRLNDTSVNTIRVLTYHTGNAVEPGKSVLRFGKPGSPVDNGGFFAGVDPGGSIDGNKFNYIDKTRDECPFSGQKIPFFKEAICLAVEAHSHIPQLFSVGWDIVVTPAGPMILEGNDGWEPFLTQAPKGNAQRKTWDRLLGVRREVFGAAGRDSQKGARLFFGK